ncbi:hypothetical protein [Aeromonas popoffii]|jgi:hypothetical protein|uniref:Uncharacterized protein n=1 Tax=Aeromonas popoffii TaxID=70856 RepID=A0ABS5GKU2_9GAMM|nr:hypothetical protein [Aeromonas popoffii]MBR7627759.1 hypothetical protein [Aeromonas popoffii]
MFLPYFFVYFVFFISPGKPFSWGKVCHPAVKKACGGKRQALTGKAKRGVGKMLRRFYPNWVEKANTQTFQLKESGDGSQKQGLS